MPRLVGAAGAAVACVLAASAVASDPPETVIDSGPGDGSRIADAEPAFTFSSPSADVAGFECRVGDAPFEPCVAPHVPAPLADARHTFEVRAVDSGGQADPLPAARTFAVDTKPPGTKLRGPRGRVDIVERRKRAVLRFGGRRGAKRFECRIERRAWDRCRSPQRMTRGPGRHRFRVRAIDRAGNVDPTPAKRVWRVVRWEPRVNAARRWAAGRAGHITFSVDQGWRRQGHGQTGTAAMASTLKVMLMVAYLRRSGVRGRSLRSSERGMIGAMIRRSDDYAATRIRDIVGPAALRRLADRAGMQRFSYHSVWGLSRSSPADQSTFMRRLQSHVPARHWGFARRELKRITPSQRWGIGAITIRGWDLHFKGGWGSGTGKVDHQIALLRRGDRRIGVAIFTENNPSHSYGKRNLREVAKRLLRDLPSRPG